MQIGKAGFILLVAFVGGSTSAKAADDSVLTSAPDEVLTDPGYELGPWTHNLPHSQTPTLFDPAFADSLLLDPSGLQSSPDSDRIHDFRQEVWLTRPYEAGVIDRLLVEGFARLNLSPSFALLGGVSFSLFDQWGVSLLGISGIWRLPDWRFELTLGLQHESWPGWNMSENRLVLYGSFAPLDFILVSIGYSYRSPQYAPNFIQSLGWVSSTSEFGLLYRVEVEAFRYRRLSFILLVHDYDRMKLYTWTNIHFALQPRYELSSQLSVQGSIGIAAEGVSGGVISWEEQNFAIGMAYVIP
jgi:hypothetical protein